MDDTVAAETESRTNVATTTALILLTVTAVLAARELHAQDPPSRDNAVDPTPVYQVIVPMDKDLNPVGDYDYLPLEFYDTIHRRARESTSSPRIIGWSGEPVIGPFSIGPSSVRRST